jgi:hypothetical protein
MDTSKTARRCAKRVTPTERRIARHAARLVLRLLAGSGRIRPQDLYEQTPPPATPEALGELHEDPPLCAFGQGEYTRPLYEEDI